MFVEVLLDQNLSRPLDYEVPSGWKVEVGMRVEVPVRSSIKKGTISKIKEHSLFTQVKSLVKLISQQTELSEAQWKLAEWISYYYATPLQRVIKCFIPSNIRNETQPKGQRFISLNITHKEALDLCKEFRTTKPKETALLELLLNSKKGKYLSDLIDELQIARSVVDRLVNKGWIRSVLIKDHTNFLLEEEFFLTNPKTLNDEQQQCLNAIVASIEKGLFSPHLIHGITGSGKTEVYLQAIAKTLELGKGTILLVPEVSLTSQTIERFRARFNEKIAVLHHKKSQGERTQAWEALKEGKIQVAIGARSALFCPIQNLGLIIVDEEHDSSYKQTDEIPLYQARDVAVMRAKIENATIILGSATPSLESYHNSQIGKYQLHTLSSRATQATLPQVKIIDMKQELDVNGGFTHFSNPLIQAIQERLKKGEQTLLFLNKRGYHRSQMCGSCRKIVMCPHCDLGLTFHKTKNLLICHLCDHQKIPYRHCPSCNSVESLSFKGFGTEHVERSLHALFPEIRTLRMDRDTTQTKEGADSIFKQFRSHKADVLIGTQMIAKGFHFPAVTLVGILNADATLMIPDFRAAEQLFQMLTQVAGRAGRAELPGEVILQTFLPDHPLFHLAAKQNYRAFYEKEIEERAQFLYPPFCHLIKFLFTSTDVKEAENNAVATHQQLQKILPQEVELLPVVPSGHPKIKDVYRFQFLLKTKKIASVLTPLATMKIDCLCKIDVNPISTFF